MTFIANTDFYTEVAKGNVAGHSIIHKFGRNNNVNGTLTPVTSSGVYQTPTSAVSLEFVSSSANDSKSSTGMHELTVVGLDDNWDEQTVVTTAHETDGTIAVNITGTWLRVYRAYISKSGSYATASTSSHIGTITIRVQGGGATYAEVPLDGSFGLGQSLIGAYTVPNGFSAYILSSHVGSDVSGTKTTDYFFFKRDQADDTTSPYSGTLRVQQTYIGTESIHYYTHVTPDCFPEKTDIGFLAKADATSDVFVEFELILIQN